MVVALGSLFDWWQALIDSSSWVCENLCVEIVVLEQRSCPFVEVPRAGTVLHDHRILCVVFDNVMIDAGS